MAPIFDERYYKDPEGHQFNLSFAGCGFLGVYHSGVIYCIKEFAPHLFQNRVVSGVSAGAIAATCLICEVELCEFITFLNELIKKSHSFLLGPFDPRYRINEYLKEALERLLPHDAHVLCSGRLHISLTCLSSKENIVVSHFKTRDELIRVVLCSSFIPAFSGFIPLTYKGQWVMDGALSNNMLDLDKNTITISPFAGDADICPRGEMLSTPIEDLFGSQVRISATTMAMNLFNCSRLINVVYPMSSECLVKLAQQGFRDAKRFLLTRGLVMCNLHRNPIKFLPRFRSKSDYLPNMLKSPFDQSSIQKSFYLNPERSLRTKRKSVEANLSYLNSEKLLRSPNIKLDFKKKMDHAFYLGICQRLPEPSCSYCRNLIAKTLYASLPEEICKLFYNSQLKSQANYLNDADSTFFFRFKNVFENLTSLMPSYTDGIKKLSNLFIKPLNLAFTPLIKLFFNFDEVIRFIPQPIRSSLFEFYEKLQTLVQIILKNFLISESLFSNEKSATSSYFQKLTCESLHENNRFKLTTFSNLNPYITDENKLEINPTETNSFSSGKLNKSCLNSRANMEVRQKIVTFSSRPKFTCYSSDE